MNRIRILCLLGPLKTMFFFFFIIMFAWAFCFLQRKQKEKGGRGKGGKAPDYNHNHNSCGTSITNHQHPTTTTTTTKKKNTKKKTTTEGERQLKWSGERKKEQKTTWTTRISQKLAPWTQRGERESSKKKKKTGEIIEQVTCLKNVICALFFTLHMLVCVHVLLQQFLTANGHCGLLLNCVQRNCAEKREKQNTPQKVTAISFRSKDEGVSKASWKYHEAKKKKMTFTRSMEATTRNQQQQKKNSAGKRKTIQSFWFCCSSLSKPPFFFFIGAFQIPSCHTFFFFWGEKRQEAHTFLKTHFAGEAAAQKQKRNKKKKKWRYNGVGKKKKTE